MRKIIRSSFVSLLIVGISFTASAASFQWLRTSSGVTESPDWTNSVMWTVRSGEPVADYPTADDIAEFGTQESGHWFVHPEISGEQSCRGLVLRLRNDGWSANDLVVKGVTPDAKLFIGSAGVRISQGNEWHTASRLHSSLAIELTNDQAWEHWDSNFNVDGAISGEYGISMTGASNVGINFRNSSSTFLGGFTQNSGRTSIDASSSIDEENHIISGPIGTGTLILNGGMFTSGSSRTLHNSVVLSGDVELNRFTFAQAADAQFVLDADGDNSLKTLHIPNAVTIDRNISEINGSAGIRKAGGGSLTLNGNNSTFTGRIVLDEGNFIVSSNTAMGTAPESLVTNQLEFAGGVLHATDDIELESTRGITITGGGIDVQPDKSLTIESPVYGTGALIKNGEGNLVLNNDPRSNIDDLVIDIIRGQVEINSDTDVRIGGLEGGVTSGARIIIPESSLFMTGAGTNSFAGSIIGEGTVVKSGSGIQLLSGDSTFTGTMVISSGVISAYSPSALGLGGLILSGGSLDLPSSEDASSNGIWEGLLPGEFNITDPNPQTELQPDFRMLQTTSGWGDYQTWVYTGQMYVHEDPETPGFRTVTFGGNIDDNIRVILNGEVIIEDRTWNRTSIATRTLAQGWHNIEVRGGNAGGGAGPSGQDGWPNTMGFAVDWEGRNSKEASYFTKLSDPGDGSLLRIGGGISVEVPSFSWDNGTVITALTESTAPIIVEGDFTKAGDGPFVFDFKNITGYSNNTYSLVEFKNTNFTADDFMAINLPETEDGPVAARFFIEGDALKVTTNIKRVTTITIR
ncbi:MAG: hypothetical protein GX804_08390 [Lentisphaerae bacterium]|nr:hypothetical protein [Lentisphaerota bacterium]